jgi:hypothetical protein
MRFDQDTNQHKSPRRITRWAVGLAAATAIIAPAAAAGATTPGPDALDFQFELPPIVELPGIPDPEVNPAPWFPEDLVVDVIPDIPGIDELFPGGDGPDDPEDPEDPEDDPEVPEDDPEVPEDEPEVPETTTTVPVEVETQEKASETKELAFTGGSTADLAMVAAGLLATGGLVAGGSALVKRRRQTEES